mmetsp:Transcript_8161/g.36403  ORF Transcript_8161/g.36403 Transcript_8161/m.36403 type:complete len:250 (+) Transcript_8161:4077-4826(+)
MEIAIACLLSGEKSCDLHKTSFSADTIRSADMTVFISSPERGSIVRTASTRTWTSMEHAAAASLTAKISRYGPSSSKPFVRNFLTFFLTATSLSSSMVIHFSTARPIHMLRLRFAFLHSCLSSSTSDDNASDRTLPEGCPHRDKMSFKASRLPPMTRFGFSSSSEEPSFICAGINIFLDLACSTSAMKDHSTNFTASFSKNFIILSHLCRYTQFVHCSLAHFLLLLLEVLHLPFLRHFVALVVGPVTFS